MADDKRAKADEQDMTPAPTQAEMDALAGGGEEKEKERKEKAEKERAEKAKTVKEEDMTPVPTQLQADRFMANLTGTELRERETKDTAAKKMTPEEDLTPVPTQEEGNAAKLAAMPGEDTAADGSGFTPPPGSSETHLKRRQSEAAKPASGGYVTRATTPTPSPSPPAPTPAPASTPAPKQE